MTEATPQTIDWKPGLINALVLGLLVCGIFAFNYGVDPFDLNRRVDLGLDKESVSFDLSNYAWKYPEYIHDPKPVVVIGDSRSRRLPESVIEEVTGRPTYNFAFGGATAGDAVETFFFAAEHGKLETVYFGLGALLLNDAIAVQRGQRDRELLDQPLRYYFSPFVTRASLRVLGWNWLGIAGPGEAPPMDEEAFWEYQLEVPPRQYYGAYAYPEKLLERLAEVAAHCKEEGIDLVFFMPPTHTDLQAKRAEYGIEEDYQRSLDELRKLAPVFDWDYSNVLTEDRSQFSDPFHPTDEVAARIAAELAGGEPWLARH